jgi:hypothetical protein
MKFTEASLHTLMGGNGELCLRWRSFELSLGVLGVCPKGRLATHNLQAFNQATKLRELSLYLIFPIDINLPLRFDNLTRLHMKGEFSIELLGPNTCEIPGLTDLTAEFDRFDMIAFVPRKAFHQPLHRLTLIWYPSNSIPHNDLMKLGAWLLKLLSLCPRLDTLCINKHFLLILLAALRELPINSIQSLMRGKCLVNTGNNSSCWVNDSSGPRSLEEIESMLGISRYF